MGTGSQLGTNGHDFAFTSKESLCAATCHHLSSLLTSLSLKNFSLSPPPCGPSTLQAPRKDQPSLFFSHLAPRSLCGPPGCPGRATIILLETAAADDIPLDDAVLRLRCSLSCLHQNPWPHSLNLEFGADGAGRVVLIYVFAT